MASRRSDYESDYHFLVDEKTNNYGGKRFEWEFVERFGKHSPEYEGCRYEDIEKKDIRPYLAHKFAEIISGLRQNIRNQAQKIFRLEKKLNDVDYLELHLKIIELEGQISLLESEKLEQDRKLSLQSREILSLEQRCHVSELKLRFESRRRV